MTPNKEKSVNFSLFLPLALLILEIIAVILLVLTGYEITPFLMFFLILLGVFLLYQIGRQLIARWRINQAVTKIKEAQALADAGELLKAITLWKSLLLSLPEAHFFDVLNRMENAYEKVQMQEAVQQVRAIQSESPAFFEMTRGHH